MATINQYACKVCWQERKLVEFHPSTPYLNRFMQNKLKLKCPECLTCLPLSESVWNEFHDRYVPVRHFWVNMNIPVNRYAADKAVEKGVFTLIKAGETPGDDICFTPHDGKPISLPDALKEKTE